MQVIHGVFAPCEYLEHKFVDGGLLDNVPADEVKKLGADKILTLNFKTDLNYKTKNVYDIAFKSIDILFEGRSKPSLDMSDMVIDFDLPEAKVFSTNKVDYCYNIGYVTTISKMKEIKDMLKE